MSIAANKELGLRFERDMALRFGIERVPGSGSGWMSKLDLVGRAARWSLKATKHKSVPITTDEVDEAVNACEGPGGTGEMPLWAVRMEDNPAYDMVLMRVADFERLAAGELQLVNETKTAAKRRLASIPPLLRESD